MKRSQSWTKLDICGWLLQLIPIQKPGSRSFKKFWGSELLLAHCGCIVDQRFCLWETQRFSPWVMKSTAKFPMTTSWMSLFVRKEWKLCHKYRRHVWTKKWINPQFPFFKFINLSTSKQGALLDFLEGVKESFFLSLDCYWKSGQV